MNPTDSSSGVVCALPTTNSPERSTMNVSVIVPPASIASTRGSRESASVGRHSGILTLCLTSCLAVREPPLVVFPILRDFPNGSKPSSAPWITLTPITNVSTSIATAIPTRLPAA